MRAAEVELDTGQKINATEVAYYRDSNKYIINDGHTKSQYASNKIKSLVVDENKFTDLQSKLTEAEKKAVEAANETAKVKSKLANTEKENGDLKNALGPLISERDNLKDQVANLKAQNRQSADLSSAKSVPQVVPTKIEKPIITVVKKWAPSSRAKNFIDVQGTCQNIGPTAYSDAIIEISAIGADGKLLNTVSTSIANFNPGEKNRNFSADIEVDPAKVDRIETAVGDLFPAEVRSKN